MDDRGFIFTADASLALIVILIVSASITAYIMAPYFMGQDHQHLQALASDALETMEQDGTLTLAAVKYSQNDVEGGDQILNARLETLIPADTDYNLNMLGHDVDREDMTLIAYDTATAVRVISGPKEGYLGRAWYKNENVSFENESINLVSTAWNFHNYLALSYSPWAQSSGTSGLYRYPYWGTTTNPVRPVNIDFSIPNDAIIHNAYFIQGSNNGSARNSSRDRSFGVTVNVNGQNYPNATPFTYLYPRNGGSGSTNYGLIYNYKGNIANLNPGSNNFYVNYNNLRNYNISGGVQPYDVPWFSILANYTTNILVPQGILSAEEIYQPTDPRHIDPNFPNAAGLARLNSSNRADIIQYDLSTGNLTSQNNTQRILAWNTFAGNRSRLDQFSNGVPFVFTGVGGTSGDGSAISVIKEFELPEGARIFDGYVVVNAYGAVDNAMVEVWDGTQWRVAFCSFNFKETPGSTQETRFSQITSNNAYPTGYPGYGNIPGTIYIGDKLHSGQNKVRITVWDYEYSSDYDLVGLVDSKLFVSLSYLPIKWDTYAFPNQQNFTTNNNTYTYTFPDNNGRPFSIGQNANQTYLFVGAGTTSKHIKVEVARSTMPYTWLTFYDSDTIPYAIDLVAEDINRGHHIITDNDGKLKMGDYRVRVTIEAPPNWQTGDIVPSSAGAYDRWSPGNPVIFSGTRVAVIYPKFLENRWALDFNLTAEAAKNQARIELIQNLTQSGIVVDPNTIKTEALYTGNLPNSIPVRLDLWK